MRLRIIPADEIPALIEDSMSLPPIDLTLAASAYANLAVFALVPVARADLRETQEFLARTRSNGGCLGKCSAFGRRSISCACIKAFPPELTAPANANAAWTSAIGTQTYGYYIRRRSSPTFVDFSTPSPI